MKEVISLAFELGRALLILSTITVSLQALLDVGSALLLPSFFLHILDVKWFDAHELRLR